MNKNFDIGGLVDVLTVEKVRRDLAVRFKERRKEARLTQKELADKAMVSYASLRRFESTGEVSLSALLRMAQALDCLDDFSKLFDKKSKVVFEWGD